jgi:hypothetical protein
MPITRLLKGHSFTPEDIRIMTGAYQAVLAERDLRSSDSREQVAKIIVELAGARERLEEAALVREAMDRLAVV